MPICFTPKQQEVIDLRNSNVLVSAAAGSGKTAVLVERIVNMVCDEQKPVDIDRLLVVTFTNAAAAEMRERIAAGIAGRLSLHPESEHLQRQSTLLYNAQITTIDSFCLFLVRNHFHEIGLDPAFRIADEGELKLLSRDVLQGMLEERFAREEEEFSYLVEVLCPNGREEALEKIILDLARQADSNPWPEQWLMERKQDYACENTENLADSAVGKWLFHYIEGMLAGCSDQYARALRCCEEPDGPYLYGELIAQEKERIDRLEMVQDTETLLDRIRGVREQFGRLPSKKDDSINPMKREEVKEIRDQVKKVLDDLLERFLSVPAGEEEGRNAACHRAIVTLIDVTLDYYRCFQAAKQDKKVVDFSDLEHYALRILTDPAGNPTATAREYRKHFVEILIDEYQDSNLVQEYLLAAVSGEQDGVYNRFMVGDVKQSIYKFRLARPELFLEKYETYSADDGPHRRIDLARNFRSREQVVDTVNAVFERIMSRENGKLVYDERARLYRGADYPEGSGYESELVLLDKASSEDSRGTKACEALQVAHRIQELMHSLKVTDKETKQLRPLRYSDCVILLRSTKDWDEVFKEVLEKEGIPAHITSKTGYFAAPEVQQLLQLLRVLDNPRQDIALFGVMKSIYGGFSEEEIAAIRSNHPQGTLYEALQAYPLSLRESSDQEKMLADKTQTFVQRIEHYRDLTVYLPIRELLGYLVEDVDYLNYVTALPAGGKRRANVEMLFTRASDFEKTSYFGLFHFVRYMEQLEAYEVDYGEADTLDENADVVRIMSIHKSKGLEFPVVFVSGLGKKFNMMDANSAFVIDSDLGIGMDCIDPLRRLKTRTRRKNAIVRKMQEDNRSEELRILYVALTRPKEKLILTGTLKDAAKLWERAREGACGRLSYAQFMQSGSYLDFLLPILGDTPVRVTVLDGETANLLETMLQIDRAERLEKLSSAAIYADHKTAQIIKSRFNTSYSHEQLEGLYTKTTVSELKIAAMAEKDEEAFHTFEEQEIVPYIPAFRRTEEKISGTVRGNAYHRAMELLDFARIFEPFATICPKTYEEYTQMLGRADEGDVTLRDRLEKFLADEVASLRLAREYREALKISKLLNFLHHPLAWRMWAAGERGELYREQPFVLQIPARRLNDRFPSDENVLIQGIIDVFFIEDGEIVLLDYKTDVIKTMQDLQNRYAVQLDYYGEALSRIKGLPIKEKKLYSFYLECES